jgi:dihydroneopterin aldolase
MQEIDLIHLKGMTFYAYHGVLPEEQKLGQKFLVDLDVYLQSAAGYAADDLTKTVNYAEVFQVVERCVTGERYKLLEALAERIAAEVLGKFRCLGVRVEVHKPNAPIPGVINDISVEIYREKEV